MTPETARSRSGPSRPLKRGRACMNCRFLKIKCDGAKPTCGPCRKHPKEDDCEYSDGPTRSITQILEETVSRLEARLYELEHPKETTPSVTLHDPYGRLHEADLQAYSPPLLSFSDSGSGMSPFSPISTTSTSSLPSGGNVHMSGRSKSIAMSSHFTDSDDTNRFISSAITLSPHRSVSPPHFRGNHVVAAQSIPSVRPYSLHGNTLTSHHIHGQPPQCFDHQIFTTSYETQQSLARTDMDMDHNRQRYDTAMMGDVNQQSPQPSFSSFPANSMLVHPATVGIVQGIGESGPPAAYHLTSMYKVKNGHTLTYNPEPHPFFSGAFINNMQSSCRCPFRGGPLDTILQPL
ncbi:hypothetical protein M378DRAFT_15912 [Amanita muscaria Koide BX008]|uniref:Zn(2)-C6 fungal-type domain-containing protein n=1 Tax=Amanita muscaria (strain Koide BX008) TaxID=946122 RepID=A0A0C2SV61_AMAMK|nr:hypothetical protein M378DRAFT_15912 [Amanita muscaria Koide BX008]